MTFGHWVHFMITGQDLFSADNFYSDIRQFRENPDFSWEEKNKIFTHDERGREVVEEFVKYDLYPAANMDIECPNETSFFAPAPT